MEHALIFWFTGAFTIILLCLLAFNTAYGAENLEQGISFLLLEAQIMGSRFGSVLGTAFLLVVGVTLFATQLTVFEATSRIMAENISLAFPKIFPSKKLSSNFYLFLWLQIIAGIGILASGFTEPLTLLILAASLNAVAMFVHSGLTLWVNKTLLHREIRPNLFRSSTMVFIFLFFGIFSFLTLVQIIRG